VRTELGVDTNGFLASVINPLDETYLLESSAGGLLESFTPPAGGEHIFHYNALGLLTRDDDPLGNDDPLEGFQALTRFELDGNVEVDIETALGRTKTTRLDPDYSDAQRGIFAAQQRVFTDAAGLVSELDEKPGDFTAWTLNSLVTSGKTTRKVIHGPDPRLGLAAPLDADDRMKMPSGLERVRTHGRTFTLNGTALATQIDTIVLNGRTTSVTYDGTTRRATTVTPVSRSTIEDFDPQGRLVASQLVGLEAVSLDHDERGRLTSISQGEGTEERVTTLEYHPDGNLATVTDALNRETSFEYDGAGRVTRSEAPDGRATLFEYDANGNLTSLTPPGQPAHVFRYSLLDQEKEYEPPIVGTSSPRTIFTYDRDRALETIDRPGVKDVSLDYDAAGRLETVTTLGRAVTQSHYDPSHVSAGHVQSVTATVTGEPGSEGLAFEYNGSLLTKTSWSGTVNGNVSQTYDSDFRIATQSVNATSVSFGYDADSLLTSAGSETLTRSSQTGLLTGTSLGGAGGVATALGHNGFGEVTSESAIYNGSSLYATALTRDKLGRITQNVETIQGTTTTWDYRYDTAGRLDQVKQNGSVVRTYSYDGNGNRLSVVDASTGTTNGTYDDQDRLVNYGATTYAQDATGDLTSKTTGSATTGYTYDGLGNLRDVTLPGGATIEYAIDGQNRRIGKRVDGTPQKGWLYQNALNPVAELDGSGAVVSRVRLPAEQGVQLSRF
jgi:YD repeat-containing protein